LSSSSHLLALLGVEAEVEREKEPRKAVMVKLFRTVNFIAKQNRPLSDFNPLRELQAQNGQADMDTATGILSDPGANYTSPEFVHEALEAMSEVLRKRFCVLLMVAEAISFIADESHGTDGKAHLIVYLRFPDALGLPETKFLTLIEMHLDEEKVKKWAAGLGHPIPDGYDVAMKGGLNMAYLLYTEIETGHYKGAIDWAKVLSCALDGCGYALPLPFVLTQKTLLATLIRISTDRANFSVNKGMITWANRICPDKPFNLLSHHCFGHQFALICEHSAADVPYLSRFQAALLYGWIFVHYSAVRGFGLSELLKELKLQDVKLIKAAFTRWLSHGRAVLAQRACLAPLIRVMVNQAKRLSGDKKSELQGCIASFATSPPCTSSVTSCRR
jgi:hypothetical protein